MVLLISGFLVAIAVLLSVPVVVFILEVMAALIGPARKNAGVREDRVRGKIAVLVPAHNERAGVSSTLASIRAQLRHSDRLIVIADNCTDDTAAVAASAGAGVIERQDPARPGKGYALDFGIRHLGE